MFKKSLVLLFLVFGINQVLSQIIVDSVYDASYPKVNFHIYNFSNNNKLDYSLVRDDIKIVSNGKDISIDEFDNPIQTAIEEQSIVLCFDAAIDKTRFELYKNVAIHFSSLLDPEKNELSLMSFEKYPAISSYFTNDFTEINNKISKLKTVQLSDIPKGFNLQPGGAIEILKQAKYENKAIVLLSDGNKYFNSSEILLLANSVGVPIYVVSINKIVSPDVANLFGKSKGDRVDEITPANYKDKSLQLFAKINRYKPIYISFTNVLNCEDSNFVVVSNLKTNSKANFSIAVPDTSKPYLEIDPQYLKYGAILPNQSKTLSVTLTARRKDIAVSNMTLTSDAFKIEGYNNTPFVIPVNESKKFDISYNPKDSALIFAIMEVHSDACSGKDLFISAGFPNVKPKNNTIKITNPNGGEVFVAGDTAMISWFGVLPNDLIQLQYTTDNMKKWDTMAVNISGLKYTWNVVNKIGDQNRVRIVQLWPNNIGQTLDLRLNEVVFSANFSLSDNEGHVVTTSADGTVKLFKSYSGAVIREYRLPEAKVSTNWANFSHDDAHICASYDDGRIVIWNTNSGAMEKSIKAHDGKVNSVNFSKDNTKLVSCGYDEMLKIWDAKSGNLIKSFNNGNKVWFAKFIENDTKVLFCDTRGTAKVYDLETEKVVKNFSNPKYRFKSNNVEINKDETLVAVSQNDGKASVYDYKTEKLLFTVTHETPDNPNTVVNYVAFGYHYNNPKQELIITSSSDYTARIWDAKTGQPSKTNTSNILSEHKNGLNMAVFNFDGSRILTASIDSLAKVWNLNKRELQIDTSDKNFSIARAQVEFDTLKFARTAIEEIRYKEFESYMTNKLNGSFSIYDMFLSGENADEFKILEPFEQFRIKPKESKNISLSFAPKAMGRRVAFLNVVVPQDTIKIPIVGEGYEVGLQVQYFTVDLGQVQIGDFKDTTLTALLKNKSSRNVRVIRLENINDKSTAFHILDKLIDMDITPQAEVSVTIRFYANALGKQSNAFKITTNTDNEPLQLLVFAEGIDTKVENIALSMKQSEAKVGETVNIPVEFELNNEKYNPADRIEFELQYNPKVLFLQYYPTLNIIDDTTATSLISLSFEELKANKELTFSVGMSVYDSTQLNIKNAKIISNYKYSLEAKNSVFYVSDRCVEKSKLVSAKAKFSVYPNPTSNIINVKPLGKLAEEPLSISICDINGKELKSFRLGKNDINSNLSIDISTLNAGTYLVVLTSENDKEVIRFNVVK